MKSVKIALSAVLVLALVAGVFAFAPAKFNDLCVYKFDDKGTPQTTDDVCALFSKDTHVIDPITPTLTIIGATRAELPNELCPAAPAVVDCKQTIKLDPQ